MIRLLAILAAMMLPSIAAAPTATGLRIRITRTAITVASLLGLNILSVPTQVATYAHFVCLEP